MFSLRFAASLFAFAATFNIVTDDSATDSNLGDNAYAISDGGAPARHNPAGQRRARFRPHHLEFPLAQSHGLRATANQDKAAPHTSPSLSHPSPVPRW
jgi:hypothetical protein